MKRPIKCLSVFEWLESVEKVGDMERTGWRGKEGEDGNDG